MNIEEFKKTLEIIKEDWNNESHSYKNENYFIYIKENLESSYVERTLGTKSLINIRYIIPIGAYSYSYKNNKDTSLNTIGFFNNEYEPCEVVFDTWEMYKLEFTSLNCGGVIDYYPIPYIRKINNPTCKQKLETGYTIEDFDEILAAIWKYIKEQK